RTALGSPTMSKVAGVSPTAQGSLEQTPMAHLLVYMAEKRLSGTLVFTPPAGDETMIQFAEGEACAVRAAGHSATAQLETCFHLPGGTSFAFYDGQNFCNGADASRIPAGEPLAAIWLAVRTRGIDRAVEGTLGRLGARPLKLHEQSRP